MGDPAPSMGWRVCGYGTTGGRLWEQPQGRRLWDVCSGSLCCRRKASRELVSVTPPSPGRCLWELANDSLARGALFRLPLMGSGFGDWIWDCGATLGWKVGLFLPRSFASAGRIGSPAMGRRIGDRLWEPRLPRGQFQGHQLWDLR